LVALIARGDEVHVEAMGTKEATGTDPMRRDTIFRIASLTKPIVAVAALALVEECVIHLDQPVDDLLPELANRRVLEHFAGPLDRTVPAKRAITLRDLLTYRMGLGWIMDPTFFASPVLKAAQAHRIMTGPPKPALPPAPDVWMKNLGTLPLLAQPGEAWMYDLAGDVLGVLVARASGMPLETFLQRRIFEPLGMKDTAFHVPPDKIDRLPACYELKGRGALARYDGIDDSQWASPPAFPSGSGGLVSTVDDYFAFSQMLSRRGKIEGDRLLSRTTVEAMITDQLTLAQKVGNEVFLADNHGWGFGLSVATRRTDGTSTPGRYGWAGGLGTTWYSDPVEGLTGILMTQTLMGSPRPPTFFEDFWTSAYRALDD
jgi:CubicO group peptidase (beta-lactamase class C family)